MLRLLVSDKSGKIFDIPELEAAGMKAGCFFRPGAEEFIKMPYASRLFMLPQRMPVGYDRASGKFKALENYFAVAVFMPPAFTSAYSAAYTGLPLPRGGEGYTGFPLPRGGEGRVRGCNDILPLYCYTAAGFYKGDIYVAAIRVDKSSRHDPKFIDIGSVRKNIVKIKKLFPANRLMRHLEDCALVHGCPGAQNFFLSREECPLPVSPSCNANCAGCISLKTQPRIKFTPSPEDVAEVSLYHSHNVKNTVFSFGQGCEGEPLLEEELIEKSIRLIRAKTHKGTINMNTNASMPKTVARLFDAGLDSVRVSLNSVRKEYYDRYYKPAGYTFKDVLRSIRIAKKKNGFVSINYLTMPGFTDSMDEFTALRKFIETYKIDMIQWRNLNFDPLNYFKIIKYSGKPSKMIGVRQLIASLKKSFPHIRMGYYNPPMNM